MTQENGADAVRSFLRGQNLEQVGRVDQAVDLYEAAISAGFDSSGPYDRLIFIYSDRALHPEVVRVAEAALVNVRTYEEKRAWYERMRSEAIKAQSKVPRAIPKNRGT
jgi:hypothetical protein